MNINEHKACPRCGSEWEYLVEGKAYSHLMGQEIVGEYDGVSVWLCPFCNTSWDRFTNKEMPNVTAVD